MRKKVTSFRNQVTGYRLQFTVLCACFVLLSITYHLFPNLSFAHVLKTDGSIGAVLHLDPEDDPVTGQPTGFFFEFKDKQNKFTPQSCDCIFSITENGKEIFSQPLFKANNNPSEDNPSVFFTFPDKNIYQVKVTGKPISTDYFQPFTLIYDITVNKDGPSLPPNGNDQTSLNWLSTHVFHLIGGGIIGLFLVFALIKQSFSKTPGN